jgi:hypothetical protein
MPIVYCVVAYVAGFARIRGWRIGKRMARTVVDAAGPVAAGSRAGEDNGREPGDSSASDDPYSPHSSSVIAARPAAAARDTL